MKNALAALAGWRTYIAQASQFLIGLAAMCSLLATYFGAVTLENGVTLGAVLIALAHVAQGAGGFFQRLATQSVANDLELMRLSGRSAPPVTHAPDPFSNAATRRLALFFALSLGSVAYAAPPVAIINGPKHGEPGEELIYDLSQSEGMQPAAGELRLWRWKVSPELPGRKQLTILDGGSKVRLASFPGTYYLRGMVGNADGMDDHVYQVIIPGSVPCPPVDPIVPVPVPIPKPVVPVVPVPVVPVPVPVPQPNLPAGEFGGLPAAVYALAETVVSANREAEAKKLADALEAMASQISAGGLKGAPAIVAAIGIAFNGSVPAAWDEAFRSKAIAKLKTLFEGGQLATSEKWAAVLREVVIGLRAVK